MKDWELGSRGMEMCYTGYMENEKCHLSSFPCIICWLILPASVTILFVQNWLGQTLEGWMKSKKQQELRVGKWRSLWQPYFNACTLTMVLSTIIPAIILTIIPAIILTILRSSLNEYLVPLWNLDTRLNIWSHLETSILKWMICMYILWYVCKCNAGPGEMLLMQPRLRSSMKHSCYLFITFDFAWQSTCWAVKLTSL